ncbi:MAG: hypothetical protein JWR68_1489 [Polaromonas sp.]|nr:hypothetical protein [Polaromonas sp.]
MQPPHPQTALADRFRWRVDAVQDDAIFMLNPKETVLSPYITPHGGLVRK